MSATETLLLQYLPDDVSINELKAVVGLLLERLNLKAVRVNNENFSGIVLEQDE